MTKLAIIDLDGVIADATARFAEAERIKQVFMQDTQACLGAVMSGKHSATDIYWRAVFDPANVPMDTLIEGVNENLIALEWQGYGSVYLTSRPESMREATEAWLFKHEIEHAHPAFGNVLVMKPTAFQYTKTVVWKAGTVQMLAALFDAGDILFIDDEEANSTELRRFDHPFALRCAGSLDRAVHGTEEDEGKHAEHP